MWFVMDFDDMEERITNIKKLFFNNIVVLHNMSILSLLTILMIYHNIYGLRLFRITYS